MAEKEDVLAVMTRVTPGLFPTAAPNPMVTDLMADMEMATLIAAAMAAAASTNCGTTIGNSGNGGGGSNSSRRQRRTAYGKDKDSNNLPKCPHCNKPATHKPADCFTLPKTAEKIKTAIVLMENL